MTQNTAQTQPEIHQKNYSLQNVSVPLYGPLHIENAEDFMQEQREIFKKCFLLQSPNKKVKDFELVCKLGEGAFGKVFLVIYRKRETFYALKTLTKKFLVENDYVYMALNEKRVLQSLNFPFFNRLQFLSQDKENLYFFLPFIYGGEMFTHLKLLKQFSEELAKFYAGQVILALEFLHYCNFVHRDLKPENVLIDHLGYIKITDFGFTKEVKTRLYTFCGTPEYIAPEIILGVGQSKAVDYWSLGILLYEMVKGKTPFHCDTNIETFNKIISGTYKMPNSFSQPLQDLIAKLLQVDCTRRYGNLVKGVEDIKEHQWLEQINWLALLNRNVIPPIKPKKTDNVREYFPTARSVTDSLSLFSVDSGEQDYDEFFKDF